jgi:hypothetical protein
VSEFSFGLKRIESAVIDLPAITFTTAGVVQAIYYVQALDRNVEKDGAKLLSSPCARLRHGRHAPSNGTGMEPVPEESRTAQQILKRTESTD